MQDVLATTRVALAGDDQRFLAAVADLLAQHQLGVREGLVSTLEDASERASRAHPDLCVMVLIGDFDRELAAVRELRITCGGYLMLIGPADDAQWILKCLHSGADEYLDYARLANELPAAIARFRSRSMGRAAQEDSGKVIGVMGVSGGVGTSTIAANVAAQLGRRYGSCGLVDLHLDSGDLTAILNLKPQHTLADFCAHAGRMDRSMFDQMVTRHASGVELVSAPWDPRQAESISPRAVRLLLAMARAKYPYVVLDLDNRFDQVHLEALWQADLLALVTRLDYLSIRNARRVLDRLTGQGIETERVRIVANRYGQARELSVSDAEAALQVKINNFVVDDPGRINRSAMDGKLISLETSWPRISRNLADLAISFNGRCHP